MEKEYFLSLVNNYTSLTPEEATELIALQDRFPYSQVIHNLCSRAGQDLKLGSREKLLHRSAIYATERTVLKSFMTAPRVARKSIEPSIVIKQEPVVDKPSVAATSGITSANADSGLTGQALRNDLLHELDKLKVLKQKFELSVKEFDKVNSAVPVDSKKK